MRFFDAIAGKSTIPVALFTAGIAALLSPPSAQAQVGQYNISGTGASAALVAPSNVTTGLTFSDLTRGSGLSATGNAGTFTSFGLDAANANAANTANDFLQFTITPDSSATYSLSSFTYTDSATSPGPSNIVVRSSADGFVGNLAAYTTTTGGTNQTVTLGGAAFTNLTSALTFRIIGFGANNPNSGANYALQTNPLVVNGTVSATAPEPGSLALLLPVLGTLPAAGMVVLRKRRM